jgi:hypothetical protein
VDRVRRSDTVPVELKSVNAPPFSCLLRCYLGSLTLSRHAAVVAKDSVALILVRPLPSCRDHHWKLLSHFLRKRPVRDLSVRILALAVWGLSLRFTLCLYGSLCHTKIFPKRRKTWPASSVRSENGGGSMMARP